MCGGGKYMYTEEYEHKGFPFKDFLIKLILVIIFVLLLVWLLPKFITPTTIVKDNKCSLKNPGNVLNLLISLNDTEDISFLSLIKFWL